MRSERLLLLLCDRTIIGADINNFTTGSALQFRVVSVVSRVYLNYVRLPVSSTGYLSFPGLGPNDSGLSIRGTEPIAAPVGSTSSK